MKRIFITLLSIGILLFIWQSLAFFIHMPDLIPSVPDLLKTLAKLVIAPSFYLSLFATVIRGLIGMLLSLAAATGLSLLFKKSEFAYELFRPLLSVMRSIPVISFILLALIFLDTESIPIMIAFLTMFPLLTENLTKGIRSLKKEVSEMAQSFRISGWNKLTQIIYPQLKPFLYSGLVSAVGFGWRAVIMGEVLAQCNWGIGGEMKKSQIFIAVPELIAWTLVAISISFLFDKGIHWLGNQNIPIYYSSSFDTTSYELEKKKKGIFIKDLSFGYGDTSLFTRFNFRFTPGKIYGIAAPSGRGKTTLLKLITRSVLPQKGKIISDQTQGIAIVGQTPGLLEHLTIIENIAFPLSSHENKAKAIQIAYELLEEVELTPLALRYPSALSFGQQQRVAIARAMIYPSSLLLMDEPFKGLDEALSKRIIARILARQKNNKQTILFTTHNQTELQLLADEIIYLPNLQ